MTTIIMKMKLTSMRKMMELTSMTKTMKKIIKRKIKVMKMKKTRKPDDTEEKSVDKREKRNWKKKTSERFSEI